jgi:hypothetical protein
LKLVVAAVSAEAAVVTEEVVVVASAVVTEEEVVVDSAVVTEVVVVVVAEALETVVVAVAASAVVVVVVEDPAEVAVEAVEVVEEVLVVGEASQEAQRCWLNPCPDIPECSSPKERRMPWSHLTLCQARLFMERRELQ